MHFEDIWREFFLWNADPSLYSIYMHPAPGYSYPNTSIFYGKEINHRIAAGWGGSSLVISGQHLVQAAMEDPLNEWFCLMSESCIPLVPFSKWYRIMMSHNQSIINACPHPVEKEMELTRWTPELDTVGMKREHWRKSSQWFAIMRKHAELYANDSQLLPGFSKVNCVDEHFLPSLLSFHHVENETTCADGFSHVYWPNSRAAHPHAYTSAEISPTVFDRFQIELKPTRIGEVFNIKCSGFKELCHFTARKFSPSAKFALLEHLHFILDDKELMVNYNGNPWKVFSERLRRLPSDYSKTSFPLYMIEHKVLRPLTDLSTLKYFHLQYNENELASIPIATPWELQAFQVIDVPLPPFFPDGRLIKIRNNNMIYLIEHGKKRLIPNLPTLNHVISQLNDTQVYTITEEHMEYINTDAPITSV